jgi:hypothetical protein
MSDMKCPFCHQDLETGNYYVHCHNPHWDITVDMEGTEEMWEALICAHKALDVALNCLNGVVNDLPWVKRTLDEITALEQKDK